MSPREPPQTWDVAIRTFLRNAGLLQALSGFEVDMLVMNEEFERLKIPAALNDLLQFLSQSQPFSLSLESSTLRHLPFDERKHGYAHLVGKMEPHSQSSINKHISAFIAKNRARNDASNRTEFLRSLAEKRELLAKPSNNESHVTDSSQSTQAADAEIPSCARVDAKPMARDLQMKYDIAKDEGPLRRTISTASRTASASIGTLPAKVKIERSDEGQMTPERYPGLDERVRNLETHLAIRYVPSQPRSLVTRLKFLEEYLIKLEKEYPPWAALHFNQPRRGWPPSPRQIPIVVPSHLTMPSPPSDVISNPGEHLPHGHPAELKKSSLRRAVLEKLEVQKAIDDFANNV